MPKIEIELTDEQQEKVNILKDEGISVGEAIDLLFEVKEEALAQMETVDDDLKILEKIKDMSLDVENKTEVLEENYGDAEKTYEIRAQDIKHKIKWGRDVFKF